MRRRVLGRTGLKVTELSLGTFGLSGEGYGPIPEDDQKSVIERARSCGINLFETATSYGSGRMETILGEKLGSDPEVMFATKIGTDRNKMVKCFDPTFLQGELERSRQRLKREKIDIVLLHNPSAETLKRGEALAFLEEQQRKELVGTFGASVSNLAAAEAALDRGAPVLSLPYNIFHQKDVKELGPRLKREKVGLLVHSVLLYGLLTASWPMDKTFDYSDHRRERWSNEEFRARLMHLNAVRPMVGGAIPSARAAALRFALSNPRVKSAVLGPKNVQQLDQLVREAGKPPYITDVMLGALENRLGNLGLGA